MGGGRRGQGGEVISWRGPTAIGQPLIRSGSSQLGGDLGWLEGDCCQRQQCLRSNAEDKGHSTGTQFEEKKGVRTTM